MAVKAVLQRQQYIWNLQYLKSQTFKAYTISFVVMDLKTCNTHHFINRCFQNPFWKNEGLIKSRQN